MKRGEAAEEHRSSVDMSRDWRPALACRRLRAEEVEAHRSIIVLRAMDGDAQSLCFALSDVAAGM